MHKFLIFHFFLFSFIITFCLIITFCTSYTHTFTHTFRCSEIEKEVFETLKKKGILPKKMEDFPPKAPFYKSEKEKILFDAKSWMIQLQNVKLNEVRALDPDILVIDYSKNGGEDGEWKQTEVLEFKRKSGKERILLAYLSIGEAETYRFYWKKEWEKNPPLFMGPQNPIWQDNYKVKFWMPEWKNILYGFSTSYLDRIISQGFDGIYIDTVDSFEFWLKKGYKKSKDEMIKLVVELSKYAKSKKEDFLIVPQNGLSLVTNIDYLSSISAAAGESIYYIMMQPADKCYTYETVNFLRLVRDSKRKVLVLEYLNTKEKIDEFFFIARKEGFLPCVGNILLDSPPIF